MIVQWTGEVEGAVDFRVTDMTGRVLAVLPRLLTAGSTSIELPIDGLPAGIYLLSADNGPAQKFVRVE